MSASQDNIEPISTRLFRRTLSQIQVDNSDLTRDSFSGYNIVSVDRSPSPEAIIRASEPAADDLEDEDTVEPNEATNERFKDLLPTAVVQQESVLIVGVGAIGRNLAIQLASMGFTNITIVDPDTVDITNVGTQGYKPLAIGIAKTICTKSFIHGYTNTNTGLFDHFMYFKEFTDSNLDKLEKMLPLTVVFMCVDSMSARKEIFDRYRDKIPYMIDARMGAMMLRVIVATKNDKPEVAKYYESQLFTDEAGLIERCTSKSTLFCASTAASFLANYYIQYITPMEMPPLPDDIQFDFRGMDFIVHAEEK